MHHKQNNRESKTYVQGLRSFGNTLPRGIKGILKKSGYNYSEIISRWSYLVGKEMSSYCYPKSIKITKENKKGTLILMVERGNEVNVEYSKKEIINKINSYFGYALINEIKLNSFSKTNKKKEKDEIYKFSQKYKKKIEGIESIEIRNSLYQLIKIAKK